MVSRTIPVDPFDLVVFGGTGDLARRKILPALFTRFCAGQVPDTARIFGAARSDMTSEAYRVFAAEALKEFVGSAAQDTDQLTAFQERLEYVMVDAKGETGWRELGSMLGEPSEDRVRAFYFSVGPGLF